MRKPKGTEHMVVYQLFQMDVKKRIKLSKHDVMKTYGEWRYGSTILDGCSVK
jgi:hypothetical protein